MIDRDFGHWLAGFIDGEGCFYITRDRARRPWRARFSMALRADDRPILEECKRRTGIGTIHDYKTPAGQTTTRWMIQSRADCAELQRLLTIYPLRAKKARDFEVWSEALVVERSVQTGRGADNEIVNERMATLKQKLAEVRREGLHA